MKASLDEYRNTTKVSDADMEQLKQDVNFYRQESTIYEDKNNKLSNKLSKLKK